jgi:TonB family protein
MPKSVRFWTNVALIAAAHAVIIVGLIRWSRAEKDAGAQRIVWMSGGGGDGIASEKTNPLPRKESKTEPLKEPDSDEDQPFLASAPSEIQLPTPKPSPTPTIRARPPKTSPTPKIKGTPKPTPRPKPKPTPKPSPKRITLVKASPTQSMRPTPEKVEADQLDSDSEKAALVKDDSTEKESTRSAATQTSVGKGNGSGSSGGHGGWSANDAQFGWYGAMLHDRFYSEWAQPTNVSAGSKSSVLVKLRIEKDGRVSTFEIVRPSGNSELDESVRALAHRVARVEPLPDALGNGDHYDVKINFELNSE